MNKQKLSSTRLLIPILVGSLGGNAWFIYHVQTSPRQVQVHQEIPSQTGTSDVKLSPNQSLLNSHQQSQARVSMTADVDVDVDEAVNDVLKEDLTAKLSTENGLISGLIDSGYTKDQIVTIMYDPGSLPQSDSESGLETLTPEEWEFENELAEGLRADGLSDEQIDTVLHDPGSLPQPDSESGLKTLTPEEWEFENELAEGLRADGLSDEQIDTVLHDPGSLPQPDDQIPFTPTPEQRARVEDAGL